MLVGMAKNMTRGNALKTTAMNATNVTNMRNSQSHICGSGYEFLVAGAGFEPTTFGL